MAALKILSRLNKIKYSIEPNCQRLIRPDVASANLIISDRVPKLLVAR